jgi:hypothetical protein
MRHILRAEVTPCVCQEEGLDGTAHAHPQHRTFQQVGSYSEGLTRIIQPCSNHVTNYADSMGFVEVEVERTI